MPPNSEDPANNPYPTDNPPAGPSAYRGVAANSLYPVDPKAVPTRATQPHSAESQPVGPAPPEPPKNWREKWRGSISTISILLLAPLIAWSISAFALQSYQVDGESMENTLQNDDRLIIDKVPRTWARLTGHQYVPKRGDIIIFNLGPYLCGRPDSEQLIKRVIGLPGERVKVAKGKVTVFNQEHPDGFDPDTSGLYNLDFTQTDNDRDDTVGSDQIFVLGDNRHPGASCDSRYFGPIKTSDVVGKLSLRIMPFNKWHKF